MWEYLYVYLNMWILCTYIVLTYYGSHIDPGTEEAKEEEASLVTASSFRASCSAVPFEVGYAVYEKRLIC